MLWAAVSLSLSCPAAACSWPAMARVASAHAEWIEMSNGESWVPVKGPEGTPLRGADLARGVDFVAFKTGKSREAWIGYVLLGS